MKNEFQVVFERLKKILQKQAGSFTIKPDSADKYGLYAKVGPATVKIWGGKMKHPIMPLGWTEIGKAYVSYHLMPIYGNTKLVNSLSKELRARMQGKTCFNFKKTEEPLFNELEKITAESIAGFKKMGFIID